MAQDETEFDKLLRETREWEARDRLRHKSQGMREAPGPAAPHAPPGTKPPMVSVEEITARSARPLSAQKITTLAAPAIKAAFKSAAAKSADGERPAKRTKGGAWGWIWAILILFFLIRHFSR